MTVKLVTEVVPELRLRLALKDRREVGGKSMSEDTVCYL